MQKKIHMPIRAGTSGFKLSLLSAGHFFNDLYASFLPTFIPTLIERLSLTMTQAGMFSSLLGVIHIIFQPLLGYMSDRSSNPWLIIWGPVLTCLGATLIPLSPSYGMALLFVGMWGLGSAMFHPQGHGGVGHVVPRERLTVSLAVFAVAGTAGVTLSPLFAVFLAETVGFRLMPVVGVLPVLLLALFTWRTMPSLSHESGDIHAPQKGLFVTIKTVFAVIYPVWAISTIRDATSQGVRMFFPIRLAAEGGDIGQVGTVLFLIMLGSTISMIYMGRVADRLGKKKVLLWAMSAASVFLFLGRLAGGWTAVLCFVIGMGAISGTMPISAAMAQEMVPNSRGMASSIVMGLSWGVGNLLMGPFGKIGDLYGVNATLTLVAILPLLSLPILFTPLFRDVEKQG